jgi:hypothetical protein
MIRVFDGQRLVHEDPASSDLQVGTQWVRSVDPAAFDPTPVPTWEAPGGRTNYLNSGIRTVRRMTGSNGKEYLVVASDH